MCGVAVRVKDQRMSLVEAGWLKIRQGHPKRSIIYIYIVHGCLFIFIFCGSVKKSKKMLIGVFFRDRFLVRLAPK
jgi:hypothetical protein